jgi:hypothetical protein
MKRTMNKIILLFNFLIFFACANAQNVGIGTTTPAASAALEVNSITGAFLLPRMTSTQRNALTPVEGMVIYNTDFSKFQGYGLSSENADQGSLSFSNTCTGSGCGSKWQSFTQGSFSGILTSIKMYLVGYGGCLPATVTVKIRSGTGTGGAVLQATSVIVQSAGIGLYTVPFHTVITSGSVYTIEFISPATGCRAGGDNVEWEMNSSDTYLSGHAYCCSELMNQDFAFTTYMGTFGWVNLY